MLLKTFSYMFLVRVNKFVGHIHKGGIGGHRVCVFVNIYMYIYMYVCVYIYIYTHIYIL